MKSFTCLVCALLLVAIPSIAESQQGTITGQVVGGVLNRPLDGAQVSVPGTGVGVVTNSSGRYLLLNVPVGQVTVSVVLIGYGAEELTVSVTQGAAVSLDFNLREVALALDEIVVTGTAGSARRREIGNSISAVRADILERASVIDVSAALSGTVPGLTIEENGGQAGMGSQIRIRGVRSITQSNRPLIYVDGVRIHGDLAPNARSGLVSSPLNDIDPRDIERIEVIKGASATTLYGTEAASGVIQIFTKTGSNVAGPAVWNVEVSQGFSMLPSQGPTPPQAWFDTYGPDAGGLHLDQWKETGYSQKYVVAVRGRAERMSYSVSASGEDITGVLPTQGSQKVRARANITFDPHPTLRIASTNGLTYGNIDWLAEGNDTRSFLLNVMRGTRDYTGKVDERVFTDQDLTESTYHITSGLNLLWNPSSSLSSKLVFGIDYIDMEYQQDEPFGSHWSPFGSRVARRWRSRGLTADFSTTYSTDLSQSVTSRTSVGGQWVDKVSNIFTGTADNFPGPHEATLTSGANTGVTESRLREVNAGVFFQQTFGFADKFFATGGLRIDGNSAFGTDFGLQTYPKASASYVISDESFWPEAIEAMKFRVAWGQSGQAPGSFDALKVWSPIAAKDGQPGAVPSNLGNPDLGPERTTEAEVGFESTALNGRLTIDANYYRAITDDALLPVPSDPTLGFVSAQLQNVGKFRNSGVEISVSARVIESSSLDWDLGVTLATNHSEAVEMGGIGFIDYNTGIEASTYIVKEGLPVPATVTFLLTNPDEIGPPQLEADHFFGPQYPTQVWTFSSTLTIARRLTFQALGESQLGAWRTSAFRYRQVQNRAWPPCIEAQLAIDAGQINTLTAQQRFQCHLPDAKIGPSDLARGDFFKMRNLSVTWDIPDDAIPVGQNWSLTFASRNLFRITNWPGLDPESNQRTGQSFRGGAAGDNLLRTEYYNLPPPRTFVFSLRTSF